MRTVWPAPPEAAAEGDPSSVLAASPAGVGATWKVDEHESMQYGKQLKSPNGVAQQLAQSPSFMLAQLAQGAQLPSMLHLSQSAASGLQQ